MYFDLSNIDLTDEEIFSLFSISQGNRPTNNEVLLSLVEHGLVTNDVPTNCAITMRGRRFLSLYSSRLKRQRPANVRATLALVISFLALLSSWKEEILSVLQKLLQ